MTIAIIAKWKSTEQGLAVKHARRSSFDQSYWFDETAFALEGIP